MVRVKPIRKDIVRHVVYDEERWKLLNTLRLKAINIMEILEEEGIKSIVHGSVARGDVHKDSDIDIVIPYEIKPCIVEAALIKHGLEPILKRICQATPWHVIKCHIILPENTVITFPITPLSRLEREFYKFGGEVTLADLKRNIRRPGIDKRLMLIIPVEDGHIEESIFGREIEAAKILGISLDIIEERKKVLLKRDEIGRTGIFVDIEFHPYISFEEMIFKIARRNIFFRKKLRESSVLS